RRSYPAGPRAGHGTAAPNGRRPRTALWELRRSRTRPSPAGTGLRDGASIPLERAFPPDVDQAQEQNPHEHPHLDQAEDPELPEDDRPRVEEDRFDVEHDEEHGDQIETGVEALPRRP